jgi:MFS family permease
MSYLINFVVKTLGIDDYLIPLGVIIVGAAVFTGVSGVLFDKFGRKNFYYPLVLLIVVSTFVVYLMKFMPSSAYLPVLYVGGIIMLGCMLAMTGALTSTFQDYIPKGTEGRFQGVRMCFTVLIPMIVGPIITLAIGINSFNPHDAVAAKPPFEIFLASSIVALLTFIPLHFVRKDSDRLRNTLLEEKEKKTS